MFPASSKAAGQCMAVPDVCKTPTPVGTLPIPYPNTALLNQAQQTSTKVKFMGKEAVTLKSEIPRSMGDEAGTAGGVVSGNNMDKVTFKKGSTKVKVEGQPCIHLTALSSHNGANANMPAGTQMVPSQIKVLVMP